MDSMLTTRTSLRGGPSRPESRVTNGSCEATPRRLVHIVDDDGEVRRSTAVLLGAVGYRTQTWADGRSFLRGVPAFGPSCVLLDLIMPDLTGIEVQEQLRDCDVRLSLIFMTGAGQVQSAVRAIRSGAFHFLEKPFDPAELHDTLAQAFAQMDEPIGRKAIVRERVGRLTRREHQVLAGLAAGLPNKSIAFDLGISPRTIEVHRANIMRKVEANSFAEVLRLAFEAGM